MTARNLEPFLNSSQYCPPSRAASAIDLSLKRVPVSEVRIRTVLALVGIRLFRVPIVGQNGGLATDRTGSIPNVAG